jgi:hypothetical protein
VTLGAIWWRSTYTDVRSTQRWPVPPEFDAASTSWEFQMSMFVIVGDEVRKISPSSPTPSQPTGLGRNRDRTEQLG